MATAVVVGSGPNGLAGAIRLAQHGVRVRVLEACPVVGGGTRSSITTVEGLIHDDCSAVHPLAVASPFLQSLNLSRHGLRWRWPEVDVAHPLDSGKAGTLRRSVDDTARTLGSSGLSWRRVFGPLAGAFDDLARDVLEAPLSPPRHPLLLARFASRAAVPATWLSRRWRTPEARALFGGIAAHAAHDLRAPFSSAIGVFLAAAGHACGWPVAEGGAGAISTAMMRLLQGLGGLVETGITVGAYEDLGEPDIVLLDVPPKSAAHILRHRLPPRVSAAYLRYQHGPGAFKLDIAIQGDVPWISKDCSKAGTVHLGGGFEELVESENLVQHGRVPKRPFVLLGQQYLADRTRSVGDINPIWAYAHVPNGSRVDVSDAVIKQIERFAPGFRKRIVKVAVRSAAEMYSHNPNYIGGDINGGANSPSQLVTRPRISLNPYATGLPGIFLCSASTPPGAGVHGMCGFNAANQALRHLGIHRKDARLIR